MGPTLDLDSRHAVPVEIRAQTLVKCGSSSNRPLGSHRVPDETAEEENAMAGSRARTIFELTALSSILWNCGGRAELEWTAIESVAGAGGAAFGSVVDGRGGYAGNDTLGAAGSLAFRSEMGGSTGKLTFATSSAGAAFTTSMGGSTSNTTTTAPCGLLIDDMERSPGSICEDGQRRGAWYSYNDESPGGKQWPERTIVAGVPIAVVLSDRVQGGHSMHTYGGGFEQWGAGIGFDLAFDGKQYKTFDAADYDGIRFWSKGSGFDFRVGTQATTLPRYGGICPEEPCAILPHQCGVGSSEQWRLNEILFSELRSPSTAGGTLARDVLTNVQFQASHFTDFDFWIDDVSFFVRPECCLGPLPRCELLPVTDPALELMFRNHTGRGNRKARCRDACDLTQLRVENVTNLAGLECLPQLKSLTLTGTFADLSPLTSLTSLTSLDLSSGALTQLTPLRNLSGMTQLTVRNAAVSDLVPVAALVNLTTLELPTNRVTTTTPLATLQGLISLNLANNPVENLDALARLPNLRKLTVGLKDMAEFRFPKGFPALESLEIAGGYVTRIVLPEEAPNLQAVAITGTEVREVVVPSTLSHLMSFRAEAILLTHLTFTGAIPTLEQLSIANNPMQVLTLPAGMTGLREVDLQGNPLAQLSLDADAGRSSPNGFQMNVSESRLNSLEPFRNLVALRTLVAMNSQISDLAPLLDIQNTKLDFVNLDGNPIDCVEQAATLATLKSRGLTVVSRCTK
jgi:CDGSH-type Zn-finger protein